LAFEVDGVDGANRLIGGLTLGSLVVRTGDAGWKSSTIQVDGSIEQDWMAVNFDSVPWANTATDGPTQRALHNGSWYLGLEEEMGAKFMSNPDGGNRQYFRKLFTIADGDQDEVPDAVDLCPQDPTGGERDSNGNGLGDSCDFCPDCPNIAYGKPVSVNGVLQNSPSFESAKITNGQVSCDRWKSNGDTGWVEIDLGTRYSVCSARWYNSADCGKYEAGTQAWRMVVRDEDGEEVEVGVGDEGGRKADSLPRLVDFGLCQPARYVKFYVTRAAGNHAALSEIQVYGEPL
jgi:hypothetical protein